MTEDNALQVLEYIQRDDYAAFSALVKEKRGVLSYSLGRFPLLSICYLYNSTKLLRFYAYELMSVSNYRIVEEPSGLYSDFKEKAGVALRHFSAREVSPLDMLAVLGNVSEFTTIYPRYKTSQEDFDRYSVIFQRLHGARLISLEKGKVKVTGAAISCSLKRTILAAVGVAMVMSIFFSVVLGCIVGIFGGTGDSTILLSNANQLEAALNSSGRIFALSEDIVVQADLIADSFDGVLDGGGHTIFVENGIDFSFSTLLGTVKNVTIEFERSTLAVMGSKAFFVQSNSGVIENIKLTLNKSFTDGVIAQDGVSPPVVYVSGIAVVNRGTIRDCEVSLQVTHSSDGKGDVYFSAICGENYGTVSGCTTSEGSVVSADTVDVGGIAAVNYPGGIIDSCTNNADITQITQSESWYPNVGGIACVNRGSISASVNNGDMHGESSSTDNLSVFVGGIVATNYNAVIRCKNMGNLTALSGASTIYVGGIAARCETYTEDGFFVLSSGSINQSGAFGKITANNTPNDHVFIFGGGIAGYSCQSVTDSFSGMTYETQVEAPFFGGVAGIAAAGSQVYNNYYVKNDMITLGVDGILSGSVLYLGSSSGSSEVDSLEDLKLSEVYWE